METLKPVEVSEYYITRVASGMSRYLWDNIFKKIFEILKDKTVYNSKDDVLKALRNGTIWYENGAFRGKFTNSISKTLEDLGAKFRNGAYVIDLSLIPSDYSHFIAFVKAQNFAKANDLLTYLLGLSLILPQVELKDYIQPAVEGMYKNLELNLIKAAQEKNVPVIELGIVQPKVKIPKAKAKNIEKYWKEYDKKADEITKQIFTLDKDAKDTKVDIEVLKEQLEDLRKDTIEQAPQLDIQIDDIELDAQSKKIAEDYTYNMQYWVKKWEVKNIIKMRQDVLKMIQQGARVPRIQEYFEKRWKIAKNKAQFLAINESHLAASVIKATQYQIIGCPGYKWGRSSSKEKRLLHEKYYGKFFTWDDKPIIDEELGIRGYPRQIWNCKCHMLVVVPTINEMLEKRNEVKNAKRNIFKKIFNSKQLNNNSWRYRRFGQRQTL